MLFRVPYCRCRVVDGAKASTGFGTWLHEIPQECQRCSEKLGDLGGSLRPHYSQNLLRQEQGLHAFIPLSRAFCVQGKCFPPPPKLPIKAEFPLGQKPRMLGGPEEMLEAARSAAMAILTPTIPVTWGRAFGVSLSAQEGPHLELPMEGQEHAGREGQGSAAQHRGSSGTQAWC